MKTCIFCRDLTNGSVGAAGTKLNFICSNCRKKEDGILGKKLEAIGKVMRAMDKEAMDMASSLKGVREC